MPRRSNREIGREWEEEVRNFFNTLGFENVDGGENFRPGEKQVDAVAGIHNVLFICECKTKHEIGTCSNLSKMIEDFRKSSKEVIEGLKTYRGKKYHHYTHFILLFVTKDILWNEGAETALSSTLPENTFKAHKLDEESLSYYLTIKEELSSEIALFHFLSDFGIRFPSHEALEVIALKNTIKGITIYNFSVLPQKLLPYVTVARRESRKKDYYQRLIDGERCEEILAYLDKSDDLFKKGHIIPGNIILASQPNLKQYFEESLLDLQPSSNPELVRLKFPPFYGCFWVVDGQHRLYAYSKTHINAPQRGPNPDDCVFVTLLHNISIPQQRQIFVDINEKHKGIDMNYIIDIEGEANPNSYMGRISRLIKKLDTTPQVTHNGKQYKNEIFFNSIKIPSHGIRRKRKYSLKGIYDAISRKKLISKKITIENIENPYFHQINFSHEKEVDNGLEKLCRDLIIYFFTVHKILGSDLDQLSENRPRYTMTSLLQERMREGLIAIMIGFFERIIAAKHIKENKTISPDAEDFKKYLIPLAGKLKQIKNREELLFLFNSSGLGNREISIRRLCIVVRDAGYKEFDFSDLDTDIRVIANEVRRIEDNLRELINSVLTKTVGLDWCKGKKTDVLPGEIFNQLKQNRKSDIERNPKLIEEGKLYLGLTLGLSKQLILHNWDHFRQIFVSGEKKFRDKDQFTEALKHLELYRNTEYHGMNEVSERRIIREESQKRTAEEYINIFNKVFEDFYRNFEEIEESTGEACP